MADRSRRVRRQVSDVTEESPDVSDAESEDLDPRKADTARRAGKPETQISPASRSKRAAALPRTSPSNGDSKQSIKLTMKVAPSKLREVMRANEVDALRDTLGGGAILDGPRSRRAAAPTRPSARASARARYVAPQESDLEDEEEDEEEDAEAEMEDDTAMNDFDEIGAEAEGGTEDDEDIEMEDSPAPAPLPKKNQMPPKPPKITLKTPNKKAGTKKPQKPAVVVTPADVGPVQSVEDQEMEEDDDDIEGSELPDEDDEEDEEEDEEGEDDPDRTTLTNTLANMNQGEAEDDGEEDDESSGSDDELASGTATPDPTKMTARQRKTLAEPLMELDMAPQQRKFFTDEEKAMKKDEHARKRKELTKRKVTEEKNAALNRLLKPQVSKTRGAAPKAETLAAQMAAAADEEIMVEKADPMFTRWISTKDGVKLGVPDEWLGKNVGRYFGPPLPPSNGRMVQEVE